MAGIRETAVAFVRSHLKQNPEMPMSELKKLGKREGINIYPLIMGYAKKELGLGRARPGRKPGRKAAPTRGTAQKVNRRGRPAKARGVTDPAAAISGVLTHVRELEREVQQLRSALSKIQEISAR